MKFFANKPEDLVNESLKGLCVAHPSLRLLEDYKIIYRNDIDTIKTSQVTIISGGGSGHEPSHAGFVGKGMLSAAVCGVGLLNTGYLCVSQH
jgi:triose/dihydroxyacetone kinase / FAD-AMP lyase (cyclizing)